MVQHKHLHLSCCHGQSGIPAPGVVGEGVVFICHHINEVNVCLQWVGWHHVAPPPCCHWEELIHQEVKASRHLHTGVATEDSHRGVGHHNCASEVLAALELQAVVELQEKAEYGDRDVGGLSIVESGGGGDADNGGGGIHSVALGANGHHGDISTGLDYQGFMGSVASSEFQVSREGQWHSDIWPQGDVLGDGAAVEHHQHLGVSRAIGGEQQLQVCTGRLTVVLWEHSQELLVPVAGTEEHTEGKEEPPGTTCATAPAEAQPGAANGASGAKEVGEQPGLKCPSRSSRAP